MGKILHVAFGTDSNYIMQCGVAITSLCENNKDLNLVIHVLCMCKENEFSTFNILAECCTKYQVKVDLIRVTEEHFTGMPELTYISKATYLRLLLPQVLKDEIGQVLYLDSDLVILGDLHYFTDNPLSANEACAAAIDVNGQSIKHHNRIGIPIGELYHNAGVLYMNLTYWRAHSVSAQALEDIRRHQYPHQDQDAINALLYDKIRTIPYEYNLQTSHFLYPPHMQELDTKYHQQLKEAMAKPVIIHYASYRKPWQKECPLQEYWLNYKKISLWRETPLLPATPNPDTLHEAFITSQEGHKQLFYKYAIQHLKLFYYASRAHGEKLWLLLISVFTYIEIIIMKFIYLLLKR